MGDSQSGVVNVKIYDREYALRTSGDAERLQVLCSNLDKRMRDVAETTGAVDTLKVAILTALSLADDLFQAREDLRKIDESLSKRSLECASILDRFLN